MGKISKTSALFLTLIIAMSHLIILTVKPVNAQSIPKSSIPEFTLKFVPALYNTTYPYTGASLQVNNSTIQVSIKNQPFTAPSSYSLYYHLQTKGHFENDSWNDRWDNFIEKPSSFEDSYNGYGVVMGFEPSKSDYTVLTFIAANYPTNAQIDFQVQAVIYNLTAVFYSDHPLLPPPLNQIGHYYTQQRLFETGDWSPTKTITIPETTTSPNPTSPTASTSTTTLTPTSTPIAPDTNSNSITLPLNTFIIIIAVLGITIVALSVLALRRHRTTNSLTV